MPSRSNLVFATAIAALSGAASGQAFAFNDDFESYATGGLPGAPWADVITRIDNPTIASPTATVVNTTDAFGAQTQAIRTREEIGTSQGILTAIPTFSELSLSVDVRLDQFVDNTSGSTWTAAMGFIQDGPADDFNQNPQAVVYASALAPTFRIYIDNGGQVFDFALTSTGPTRLDTWYNLSFVMDTSTGFLDVKVTDIATGQVEGSVIGFLPSSFDSAFAQYDAVAFFDGEYGSTTFNQSGIATFDNVAITAVPAPGPAAAALAGLCIASSRRRRTA
ncbi:MAG: hypothetical protein AAGI53_00010 [Planctomycetota bacterium]